MSRRNVTFFATIVSFETVIYFQGKMRTIPSLFLALDFSKCKLSDRHDFFSVEKCGTKSITMFNNDPRKKHFELWVESGFVILSVVRDIYRTDCEYKKKICNMWLKVIRGVSVQILRTFIFAWYEHVEVRFTIGENLHRIIKQLVDVGPLNSEW